MILFCGIPSEAPLRLAIGAAERAGAAHLVLSQRHAAGCALALEVDAHGGVAGALHAGGAAIGLDAFTGVYARLVDASELPAERASDERARVAAFHGQLQAWLELAPCTVMNRTSAMASNASKPFQAQLIARAGFAVPRTLVTNDPAEVRTFRQSCGRVIYKSVSGVRSIVKELEGPSIDALERVRSLPTQFQELIRGTNVRVHVVRDEIFATEVSTEAIDYRYARDERADVQMRPYQLPEEVASRCVDLSRRLGLPFCGIDLKRTPAGGWRCFEVNPSPGYSWFEQMTGQDISGAIVRALS